MKATFWPIFLILLGIQAHGSRLPVARDSLVGACELAAEGAPAEDIQTALWLEEAIDKVGGRSTQDKIRLYEFLEGVATELEPATLVRFVIFMTWDRWNADSDFKIYLWEQLLQPERFEIPRVLLERQKLWPILRGMLFNKVPEKFLRRARDLLDEHPVLMHREFRNIIRLSLVPPAVESAPVFPAFLLHPRELKSMDPDLLDHEGRKILGHELLVHKAFTRRMMAYLGRHPELKQQEKHHLFMNLVDRFRAMRGVYVYNPGPVLKDGTIIVLGAVNSTYFLAFTSDDQGARVFWGSYLGAVEPGHSFDFENWRKLSSIVEASAN